MPASTHVEGDNAAAFDGRSGEALHRLAPVGVAEGRVGVAGSCGAPTGATEQAWIAFCPEAAPNYGIRVTTRRPGEAWSSGKVCWRGSTSQTPRCA